MFPLIIEEERNRLERARNKEAERLQEEARQIELLNKAMSRRKGQSASRREILNKLASEVEEARAELYHEAGVARHMQQLTEEAFDETFRELEAGEIQERGVLLQIEDDEDLQDQSLTSQLKKRNFLVHDADEDFNYFFPGQEPVQDDIIEDPASVTSVKAAVIGTLAAGVAGYLGYWRNG